VGFTPVIFDPQFNFLFALWGLAITIFTAENTPRYAQLPRRLRRLAT